MMMYGEYEHNMDAKNRVFVPVKFREELGKNIYYKLYASKECPSIQLYSESEFKKQFEDPVNGITNLAKKRALLAQIYLGTGTASYDMICSVVSKLRSVCPTVRVHVYKIINRFFGESITVSGLLTGKDMAEQLFGQELGEELIIPENSLRRGEEVFLCGMTVDELSSQLGVKVPASGSDGYEFIESILGRRI